MAASFERFFPAVEQSLRFAHCLIEEGRLLEGRECLGKIGAHKTKEHDALAALFLGLSYLKEAHTVAPEYQGSYYKLAYFYFGHNTTQGRAQTVSSPTLNKRPSHSY